MVGSVAQLNGSVRWKGDPTMATFVRLASLVPLPLLVWAGIGVWCGHVEAGASAPPVAPPPDGAAGPLEHADVATEFWAAIGAEGAMYRRFRDGILARGPGIQAFLQKESKEASSWQELIMAEILLERTAKSDEVARLMASPPRFEEVRSIGGAYESYGRQLAKACSQTPMLLVEALWKDGEFLRKCLPGTPRDQLRLFAIGAFVHLREQRALWPLLWALNTDNSAFRSHLVMLTANALGELRDPRALPALLQACGGDQGVGGSACLNAIKQCMQKDSIDMVSSFAGYLLEEPRRRGRFLLGVVRDMVKSSKE